MKDAFHGSAYPPSGLEDARREPTTPAISPYRGCTQQRPRRGRARTAPAWILRASPHAAQHIPAITLDDDAPWPSIPCWSGRAHQWLQHTVPAAYADRYATQVRPVMPGNPVSLKTLLAVAQARAQFADHRTGRNCRPTNAELAHISGLSIRTVQRASTALRLLGVATEVLRGRRRSRAERYASWRVGDRGRGWASVWALHDNRFRPVSPHPEGSKFEKSPLENPVLTTATRRHSAGSSAAKRRPGPETRALALANKWVRDRHSPPWARRYRTGTPWARVLTGAARHGWTPRDINQLLTDWITTGHWLPERPHKPIGLLGAIIAAHGNLAERPAALDEAREAAERAQRRARIATQLAQREENRRRREARWAAADSPERVAARKTIRDILTRKRVRRTDSGETCDG
jgi:hypothetical protein